MATDVVFAAYGTTEENSRWLKEATASLRSFASNLRRVIVIGNAPADLPDDVAVFRIPSILYRGSRYDNAVGGLVKAIECGVLPDPFLYAPPGAVLSAPTDLDAYPDYCRRPRIRSIADLVRENKGGAVVTRYKVVLSDTRAALERNGYPALELGGRFFTRIDPADLEDVKRIWLQEPHGEFGYDAACLFGNVRLKREPFDTVSPDTV